MTDADVARALDVWLAGDPDDPNRNGVDMTGTDIETGWPDSRVVWPNLGEADENEATLPRVEVAFFPVQPQQLGLDTRIREDGRKGGTNRRRFLYQATVVTDERVQQWPAQAIAEKIVARFAAGTFVTGTNVPAGNLWVRARPGTGPGIVSGREWRLPVTIRLETLTA